MAVPRVRAAARGQDGTPAATVAQPALNKPAHARMKAAVGLAMAGAVTLWGALLAHEVLTFGALGHGVIASGAAPCTSVPCVTLADIVVGHVAKATGAALTFAMVGALGLGRRALWALVGPLWIALYLWSLVGIASGYRAAFGTGWTWWEPFAALAWSPVLTPALMLAGLAACVGLARLARAG